MEDRKREVSREIASPANLPPGDRLRVWNGRRFSPHLLLRRKTTRSDAEPDSRELPASFWPHLLTLEIFQVAGGREKKNQPSWLLRLTGSWVEGAQKALVDGATDSFGPRASSSEPNIGLRQYCTWDFGNIAKVSLRLCTWDSVPLPLVAVT